MPAVIVHTHLGWFWAVARDGKLIASAFAPTREAAADEVTALGGQLSSDEMLEALAQEVERYASGEAVDFSHYPVDLSGQSPFWRRAQMAARKIPHGQVRTYKWLAAHAGSPRGARAAGQAMAHNAVSPVIPCHRVVASDGSLGGFAGGLDLKQALLRLEGLSLQNGKLSLGQAGERRRS